MLCIHISGIHCIYYNLRISKDQMQVYVCISTCIQSKICTILRRFLRTFERASSMHNACIVLHSHGAIGSNTISRVLGRKQKHRNNDEDLKDKAKAIFIN